MSEYTLEQRLAYRRGDQDVTFTVEGVHYRRRPEDPDHSDIIVLRNPEGYLLAYARENADRVFKIKPKHGPEEIIAKLREVVPYHMTDILDILNGDF